jgi:AcrR family transcriptional regulator
VPRSPQTTTESQDTREKILDAAARLFSAADSRGASLRAIAREADVNPALVHYHFGTRESLLEAVILRALEPIQHRRQALIRSLGARAESLGAHDLAGLFVAPLLADPSAPTPEETTDLRLLTRVFSEERSLAQDLTLKHFGDVMTELDGLLAAALPELPAATRRRRIRFCVQSALETLSGHESRAASASDRAPDARATIVTDLIDFLAGGLTAPAPRAARRAGSGT